MTWDYYEFSPGTGNVIYCYFYFYSKARHRIIQDNTVWITFESLLYRCDPENNEMQTVTFFFFFFFFFKAHVIFPPSVIFPPLHTRHTHARTRTPRVTHAYCALYITRTRACTHTPHTTVCTHTTTHTDARMHTHTHARTQAHTRARVCALA